MTTAGRRPGSVSVYALLATPVLLALFVGMMRVAFLRDALLEARNAADAGATAAAHALAHDDRLLLGDPTALTDPATPTDPLTPPSASARAKDAAHENVVQGQRAVVSLPDDVVFGTWDPLQPPDLRFRARAASDPVENVNAVRVTARGTIRNKTAVAVTSTARLDTDVIGFRPMNDEQAIPLVPVALFQEPAGTPARSWSTYGTIPVGGPVPTVKVVVGPQPAAACVAAGLLRIGTATVVQLAQQIPTGVKRADLSAAEFSGSFTLRADNTLPVLGSLGAPVDGSDDAAEQDGFDRLKAALELVRAAGKPRVFPLFAAVTSDANGYDRLVLVGFVAARLTDVRVNSETNGLELDLRPAVFGTPTATTDAGRHRPTDPRTYQPTVSRVRLAE